MERRMRVAVVAAVVAMVVLVLAASSRPVDLWTAPPSDGGSVAVDVDPPSSTDAQDPTQESRRQLPAWLAAVLRGIALVAAVVAIAGALFTLRYLRIPWRGTPDRRRRRRHAGGVLPEEDERSVTVDADAARAALSGGAPRNAIVACWMQLEHDAAEAGLPRRPFETPTEYVERVIGASSVDPAPIGQLAALYREARFSRHPLTDDHRLRASAALERVVAALHLAAGVIT